MLIIRFYILKWWSVDIKVQYSGKCNITENPPQININVFEQVQKNCINVILRKKVKQKGGKGKVLV